MSETPFTVFIVEQVCANNASDLTTGLKSCARLTED